MRRNRRRKKKQNLKIIENARRRVSRHDIKTISLFLPPVRFHNISKRRTTIVIIQRIRPFGANQEFIKKN